MGWLSRFRSKARPELPRQLPPIARPAVTRFPPSLPEPAARRGERLRSAGLVDLQVHGHAGVDFNDPMLTAETLDLALEAMLRAGVTLCLPTLISAHEPELASRLAALDKAVGASRLGRLMVPGYHLAGLFAETEEGEPATPSPALIARLEAGLARPIIALTLAAELPGSLELIGWAAERGKLAAIGPCNARFEHVVRAADAGALLSAQLGSGMPDQMPALDNPVMAQLAEDRLCASFVADGTQLPPFALKSLIRAKGVDRAILVSDATAPAAAEPGYYPFAEQEVLHEGDFVLRTPHGRTMLGSALTLDRAVRNLVRWRIAAPGDALQMASTNPASLLARHGVTMADSEVEWSTDMRVRRVRLGELELRPQHTPALVG